MIPSDRGPLRVAMVSANAFPLMGGIETHMHEVSTRLSAAGVDVTILTTDLTGDLPVAEKLPGYGVRRWPAYPRSRDFYLSPGLARHLLRSDDYDVVHVQGVTSLVAPVALARSTMSSAACSGDPRTKRPFISSSKSGCDFASPTTFLKRPQSPKIL